MSTNNSREILACRRQVLSREQREDDRQREHVRSRRRRQNFSEESQQVERVRARRRRENYSEKCRQAEQERARMNRQRQREREIQRLIARGHSDIYTTLSVIMSLFCCRSLCILISN